MTVHHIERYQRLERRDLLMRVPTPATKRDKVRKVPLDGTFIAVLAVNSSAVRAFGEGLDLARSRVAL